MDEEWNGEYVVDFMAWDVGGVGGGWRGRQCVARRVDVILQRSCTGFTTVEL